jgi:hypothetical protein
MAMVVRYRQSTRQTRSTMYDRPKSPSPSQQRAEWSAADLLQRAEADPHLVATTDVQVLQRATGNRAVTRLLARPLLRLREQARRDQRRNGETEAQLVPAGLHQPEMKSLTVVQRAIWRIDEPGESKEATAVTTAVANKLKEKKARGKVTTDETKLKDTPTNEDVYILGHGTGKTVGGMGPDVMAYRLAANLPAKYAGDVKLVSCLSASTKFHTPSVALAHRPAIIPYAQRLSKALSKSGRKGLNVTGMNGIADVNKEGQIIVYDFDEYIAWLNKKMGGSKVSPVKWKRGKLSGARVKYKDGKRRKPGLLKWLSPKSRKGQGAGIGAAEWAS